MTTFSCALKALEYLRESKHQVDLVLSDVQMPNMDGFKFLENIGLEMDLPVISTPPMSPNPCDTPQLPLQLLSRGARAVDVD